MNLKKFDEHIDSTILERGLRYYKKGHVTSLEYDGEGWSAEVAGSEDYTVTVLFDDGGNIIASECDCPYDWGEYCKHQAAVFYAIRNDTAGQVKRAQPKKQAQNLESLLTKQDKAVLVSILLDYANQDKQVKNELLFRFSPTHNKTGYVQKLVRASITKASRGGFIEYGDVYGAIQGAEKALRIAEDEIDDALSCISICIIILREMMTLLQKCDDSDGYVGGVITEAIAYMNAATDNMPADAADADKVFELILNHTCEKMYDGWEDWRIDVIKACIPLCRRTQLRKKLEDRLDSFEGAGNDHDFYSQYVLRKVQNLRCNIIERYDGNAAANLYRQENLENSDFRETVIRQAIQDGQFDRALALCLEGEKADEEYRGLVSLWQHLRYDIYERQHNGEEQKKLAAKFVLSGEFPYYEKLKALYSRTDWPAIMQDLLAKMETSRGTWDIYEQILIHEDLKPELLAYCRKDAATVIRLYPYLLPKYAAEIKEIFVFYIRHVAEQSNNRNQYRQVCRILKHYGTACGAQNASLLKDELVVNYPRRSAFIDELQKTKL